MLIYRTNHGFAKPVANIAARAARTPKPRRKFSDEELRIINDMRRRGHTWQAIGDELGRDKTSVRDTWMVNFTDKPRRIRG